MLSEQEWEALCKQCGKCCHIMLEDGSRSTTDYCLLLDQTTNLCKEYNNRHIMKHKIYKGKRCCIPLLEEHLHKYYTSKFLPEDCAYIQYYLRSLNG